MVGRSLCRKQLCLRSPCNMFNTKLKELIKLEFPESLLTNVNWIMSLSQFEWWTPYDVNCIIMFHPPVHI
jgi:hypothetical protein